MSGSLAAAAVAGVAVTVVARSVRVAASVVPAGRVRRRLGTAAAPPAATWARMGRVAEQLAGRAGTVLRAADVQADATPLMARGAAGVLVLSTLALRRWGVTGLAVAALGCTMAAGVFLAWRRGRSAQRYAAALPTVLEACAGRLRAGASLTEAVTSAAGEPTGSTALDTDLGALARRIGHGQPFSTAVDEWAGSRAVPGLRLVAAALVLGAEAGGARARALDGVAATLRDRRALAAEVDALSSQARASAVVMMGAPVAFAALGLLSDPEVSAFLLRTPPGLACLLGGLALDGLAGVWMLRIARSAR